MSIAFISDIHANDIALEATLRAIAKDSTIERIYCLGDVVGFHTAPERCIEMLEQHRIVSLCGNHDAGVVGLLDREKFPRECWEAIEWTRARLSRAHLNYLAKLPTQTILDRKLWLMHGMFENCNRYLVGNLKLRYVAARLSVERISLGMYGHTHSQNCHRFLNGMLAFPLTRMTTDGDVHLTDRATYLVNPGTVGQPRDGDASARFCVFDTEKNTIRFERVPYDYPGVVRRTLEVFPSHERMYRRFTQGLTLD